MKVFSVLLSRVDEVEYFLYFKMILAPIWNLYCGMNTKDCTVYKEFRNPYLSLDLFPLYCASSLKFLFCFEQIVFELD